MVNGQLTVGTVSIGVLVLSSAVYAEELPVTTASPSPPGTTHFASIAAAIDVANAGDEIVVSEGEWIGQPDRQRLETKQGITIRSVSGPLQTAITCSSTGSLPAPDGDLHSRTTGIHAFDMVPSVYAATNLPRGIPATFQDDITTFRSGLTLSGFTVYSCGYSAQSGHVPNNKQLNGGAITVVYGNLQVYDSIFHSNMGMNGGAIAARSSQVSIVRSIFRGNTAQNGQGGAIYVDSESNYPCSTDFAGQDLHGFGAGGDPSYLGDRGCFMTISRSIIEDNYAMAKGGGLYFRVASTQLTSTVLTKNRSGQTAAGMMILAGMHTFNDVVNEDNNANFNMNHNIGCSNGPSVQGTDGLCFCLDTCTSSTDPVTLLGTVGSNHRSHAIDIGMGNFFTVGSNPYYFGGHGRVWTVKYNRPVHMVKVSVTNFELPPYEAFLTVHDDEWAAVAPAALGSMTGVSTYSITTNNGAVSVRFDHPALDKWYTPGKATITIIPLSCNDSPGNNYRDGCSNHGDCADYTVTASRPIYACECDEGFSGGDCSQQSVRVESFMRQAVLSYLNLQVAINDVPDGDTLTILSPAVIKGNGNRAITIPAKRLSLQGLSPLQTVLDCEGQGRGFIMQHTSNVSSDSASLTLKSMSIKNCVADIHSRTIYTSFAWPFNTLSYSADLSGKGAAIYVDTKSQITLRDTIITNNTAGVLRGGAVYLSRIEQPALFEDVILTNTSFGGGLMVNDVVTRLRRTFLSNNKNHTTVDETLDLDLMCSGTQPVVFYSGSLLSNEHESFNCYCKADCTRQLITNVAVFTATLVDTKLVIQGGGLANGDDSKAVTFAVSVGAAPSIPCIPFFVRPHMVICDIGAMGVSSGLDEVSLSVIRHDDKHASSAVFTKSGIRASLIGSNATSENGGTARIAIHLHSKPLHDVEVPISNGVDAQGNVVATVSRSALWFTPTNWQQVQYIDVTGVDDGIVRGTISYSIVVGATKSDDMIYQNGGEWQSGANLVPSSLNRATLMFMNLPFACSKISQMLNATGTGCDCAAGYTDIAEDGGAIICATCKPGFYKPETGNGPCLQCPGDIHRAVGTGHAEDLQDVHVSVEDCVCRPGYFASKSTHGATLECQACPDGSFCDGWGYSVADMGVSPGYWRADASSPHVLRCIVGNHCTGAMNMSRDTLCTNYTYGYLCYGCAERFGRSNHVCVECPASDHNVLMMVVWITLAFVAPMFLFGVTKPPGHDDAFKAYPLSVGLVKILITNMQMCLVMTELYPGWSSSAQSMFDGMGSLSSFYFAKFEPTECALAGQISSERFYTKFLISIAMPLVIFPIMLIFGVQYFFRNPFKVNRPHPTAPGAWEWQELSLRLRAWCINMVIGTFWISYPGVVHASLQVLVCDRDSEGNSVLRAEKTIFCTDPKLLPYRITGIVVLILMGVGMPMAMTKLVHSYRKHLAVITVRRRFGLLYFGYRDSCKYWESVVALRTAVLIAIASTIENTIIRIAVAATFLQVCLAFHLLKSPHQATWAVAARLETFSLGSFILALMATLLQAGIDEERASLPLEIVLIAITSVSATFMFFVTCFQIHVDFSARPRTNPAGRLLMSSALGNRNLVSVVPGDGASSTGGGTGGAAEIKTRVGLKAHLKNMKMARQLAVFGAKPAADAQEPEQQQEVKAVTMAEEIMFLSKEKELTQQLEALKVELGAVKRRENLTSIMSKMARSNVRPARMPPSAAMAELRAGIRLMGGIKFDSKEPEDPVWPEGIVCSSMQTEDVDVRELYNGERPTPTVEDIMSELVTDIEEISAAEDLKAQVQAREQADAEVARIVAETIERAEAEARVKEANKLKAEEEAAAREAYLKANPPLKPLPPKASKRELDFMRVFKEPLDQQNKHGSDSDDEHDTLEDIPVDDGVDDRDKVSNAIMKKFMDKGSDEAAMTFVAARDTVTTTTTNLRHLKSAIASVRTGHKDWWAETDDHVDNKSTLGEAALGNIEVPKFEALVES
eukprot:SAG31_NODE_865_length_11376_cov_4.313377_5_plen_1986_part_00